jgi:hypothetical protein
MLASLDVGTLIGAPLVGGLVHFSGQFGLPPYPTMFIVLAIGITMAGVFYAFSERT